MWRKMILFAGLLLIVFALGGCGIGKGKDAGSYVGNSAGGIGNSVDGMGDGESGTVAGEAAEPLIIESNELNIDSMESKMAGEIQDAEGYFVKESFSKRVLSMEEWSQVLEPFADLLALKYEDMNFNYDGKDETEFVRGVYRDSQGYTYVLVGRSVVLVGPDGDVIMKKEYGSAASSDVSVGDPVVSDAGEVVFPIWDFGTYVVTLVSFDRETGAERILGQMEDQFFRNPLCALRGSKVFYRSNEWIVCWDLDTGSREQFFDLKTAGTNDRNVVMGFDAAGVPELYIGGKTFLMDYYRENMPEEELVVVLSSQPTDGKLAIRILDINGNWDNGFVSSSVGAYRVGRQDIKFDYQTWKDSDEREAFQTRMMTEVASGNPADILCVDRGELCTLWRKGAIASMEELVSKETLDAILPGALELGVVDGELAGITPLVFALALATSRQDWDKDSWTMEEFMEQTRKPNREYAWVGREGTYWWSSAYELLQYAGLPSLEQMGLIDYQKGEANLDSEKFIDLLKFCKEYGMTADIAEDEYEEYKKERKYLAYISGGIYTFTGFESCYSMYDERNCNVVGFPAGDTSGNYFCSVKILAVSKQAVEDPQKKEEISAFLEYLLSDRAQRNISWYLGVRRPTEETYYETDAQGFETSTGMYSKEVVCMGRQEHATRKKADGSTYLKEFTEFMENCRAWPDLSSDVSRIILEEADMFLKGDRSAEEVARVTQNRVQLWLNERK